MYRALFGLITLSLNSSILAATYVYNDDSELIGEIQYHIVQAEENWDSIAYFYEVSYLELKQANPQIQYLDSRQSQVLIIPSQYLLPQKEMRNGIVVSLSEKRLYYFPQQNVVMTYPIAVGRAGWRSPEFSGYVTKKKIGPSWRVPQSIANHYYRRHGEKLPKVMPPGPDNPLGNFAIYTSQDSILIHGTNDESSVGKEASSGCIRLYNRDISELYSFVDRKTPVYFTTEDEKVGIHMGHIYYEKTKPYRNVDTMRIEELLADNYTNYTIYIDDTATQKAVHANSGIPVIIGTAQKKPVLLKQG